MFGDISLTYVAVLIVAILVSMVIHEAIHALVGYKLGDTTALEAGRVSLNPLHHIDLFYTVILPILTIIFFQVPLLAAKPVPFNPSRVKYGEFGAAMIAFAGPLSNLVLAIIGKLLLHGVATGSFIAGALTIFVFMNAALFVFNLIPIPPLDGSRVLYAFAPEGLQRLMVGIEQYGLFVVFGLVLILSYFGNGFSFLNNIIVDLVNILP